MVDQIVIQSNLGRKPWTILVACLVLVTLVNFFEVLFFRELLTSYSEFFLQKFPGVFSYFIPALYFCYKYENIKSIDILPKGSDFIILFLAFIFVFLHASLVGLLGPVNPLTIQDTTFFELPKIEIILILFSALIAGPFFEELLFRKYVLEVLKKSYNVFFAVIAVSLLETFIHIGFIVEWPNVLFSAIRFFIYFTVFSVIYLKSNLGISFVTHALVNSTILFLTWR